MDQSPTQKSQSKAHAPRRPSRGREALVLITVPLVAVAVTLGLFLQMGQPIGLSVAMGALAGGLLIALHTVNRRDQTIKALREELARHNAQRGMQAGTNQPRGSTRSESASGPAPQAWQVHQGPQAAKAAAAATDKALAERSPSAQKPSVSEARPSETARATDAAAVVPATLGSPLAASGMTPRQPPQGSVPPPLPPPAMPQPPAAAVIVSAKPVPAAPPPLPPIQHANAAGCTTQSAGDEVMSSYWDLRPGAIREPVLSSGEDAAAQALQATAVPAMTMGPLPTRPASAAEQHGNSPRTSEQELEVMHTLIEQLAIQLNDPGSAPASSQGVEKPAPSSFPPALAQGTPAPAASAPATKVEQSIEASLSALKVTAETMRRPAVFGEIAAPADAEPASAPEPDVRLVRKPANSSSYSRLVELTEAIAAERIEVFLDPIHGLDDRKARHFEVAIRLRSADDMTMSADDYLAVATGTGLLAKIDQAKLTRTARVADRLHARGATASVFSSVSGESLTDDGFLDTFEAVLSEQDTLPARLILTFAQSDVRTFTDAHWDTMLTMAEIGVRFSLDHITDLDMDFEELKARGFDYVKLDAPVFLDGLPAADGPVPSADICRHLTGQGLALIIGHIEDEMTMAKILGFGVVFGQGTLFGGARPVKVEVAPALSVAAA